MTSDERVAAALARGKEYRPRWLMSLRVQRDTTKELIQAVDDRALLAGELERLTTENERLLENAFGSVAEISRLRGLLRDTPPSEGDDDDE